MLQQDLQRLVLMIAGVAQPLHSPLHVGADHIGPPLDVLLFNDQAAAVDIEAGILHIYALQFHPLLGRCRLGHLIVRGAKHDDEIRLLGYQRSRLKGRGGLLNFDRFEIDVVDLGKGRHEIPLRLSRADRPGFSFQIFQSLDRRLFAPENRGRHVAELPHGLDRSPSRSSHDSGCEIGEPHIGKTSGYRPDGVG